MLENFSVDTFSPRVGEPFRIGVDGSGEQDLQLVEAVMIGTASAKSWAEKGNRGPFSLVFRGRRDAVLQQRTYRMEHDGIGSFDIFLVPIGADAEGMRYEAVFT